MKKAAMAATSASKSSRLFPTPIPAVRRRALLHIPADEPSNLRAPYKIPDDTDPASPASQIVEILKLQNNDNWKSNSHLNQLLSSSPALSAHQFLRISRHLPTSDAALKFIDHLNSCQIDPGCLSSVFQAAFELANRERSSYDRLWLLVERSKEIGVPLSINSATLLIRRFDRSIDRLMAVYNAVKPRLRNVNVRNLLLDVLFKRGCSGDARKVLDEMLEPESEVSANDATAKIVFEWIVKSIMFGNGPNEEEIVSLLSRLGERGLIIDSQKLIEVITASSRNEMKDRSLVAVDLLHCYLKLGGSVEASCCSSMLSWLAKKGEFKKFTLLMKEMEKNGIAPDRSALGIFINRLCKSGRIDESLEMLTKMRDEGAGDVSVKPDAVIYNMIIDGFCKVGRCEQGLVLMEKMKSEGHLVPNTSTYNCLIDGFCRAGNLKKSLELFDVMKREEVEPNVITINGLVNGMCRQGRINSALKFLNEMKGRGLDGNVKTYTSLISAVCDANNIKKAMELFDDMKRICKPDAIVYYTLILGFCRGGRMDDASSIMSLMREAGFRPDIGCYNAMISGFCKRKKMERGCELLKEMEMDGTKPDCVTYNTLISYFTKSGDFKMAHNVLKKMLSDGLKPTVVTYGTLIHAYCLAGDIDEAMKMFSEMSSRGKVSPNTVIYNSLIDNLCKNNEVAAALSLFDDMEVKGVKPNTNTFNAMLKGLKDIKWLDKAFELMDSMIHQGCDPDYVTMGILSEWLPSVGETDRLREFIQGFQVSDQ